MDSSTVILIVICSLSLIFSIISMVLCIVILNKQKEMMRKNNTVSVMSQPFQMEQSSAMVQKPVAQQKAVKMVSQGTIICRNCYSSIPDHAKICPCCQASCR